MRLITLALTLMLPLGGLAKDTLLFNDDFRDGNHTGNTVWTAKKSESPWRVFGGRICPQGNIPFDTIGTSDFRAIGNGVFVLEFTVDFNSDQKGGDNRFSVYLRDSLDHHNGYGATIAQGTSNNSGIEKIQSGKTVMLCPMPQNKAFFFTPGKPVKIRFSRNSDGLLELFIDGTLRMSVVDATQQRFDRVQFTMRCKTAEMSQSLGDISLFTSPANQ